MDVPRSLIILSGGVAGIVTEVFRGLVEHFKTQEEFDKFGGNMMDTIGDYFLVPATGSVMWVLYKRMCNRDLSAFVACVEEANRNDTLRWLRDNGEQHQICTNRLPRA
jgi:hypothetical protein